MRYLLLACLCAGCADRTVSSLVPVQGKVETFDIPATPNRDVDILFLIDNSGSMAEEQASLVQNFPRFMGVLQSIQGGLPNVHIGVATSSLGAKATDGIATVSFGGCSGTGDDGALRTDASINGRFIVDEEGGGGVRTRNYVGALADAFTAIANVGTMGCGIEQHLGGIERALENPVNAGFLRPAAKLAVIVIGDEDDCSLAHEALFEGTNDGVAINFRCTSDGIECDDAPDLTQAGLRTRCHPRAQPTYLEPVEKYIDYLRGTKANPARDVMVAGVIGDSSPFAISIDAMQRPVLAPSCVYGGTQAAYPALRTAAFLDHFEQHVQKTICGAALTDALVDIGKLIARSVDPGCFESPPIDRDPSTPGIQADCSVSDVRTLSGGGEQEVAVIPACGHGDLPCWQIVEDDQYCSAYPSHLRLVIDRGGATVPSDIHVKAGCVAASDGMFQ